MQVKVVCPSCGEIAKTGSIRSFRHCSEQHDVETNLLAGQEGKYQKMVDKKDGKIPKQPNPFAKKATEGAEEVVEKVEEKKVEEKKVGKVEPIIEPKPIVKSKPRPRKPKAKVEEKKVKENWTNTSGENFGFF